MIICADNLDVHLPPQSIDLIITSPPYAQRRKKNYPGIDPKNYVAWFLPRAKNFQTWLKPTGSFVLNIKESAQDGERLTYVYELVLALKAQGWRWVDDLIWHKKTCYPGGFNNRLKDGWEHCYHFTLNKEFAFYKNAVRIPAAASTIKRAQTLSARDKVKVRVVPRLCHVMCCTSPQKAEIANTPQYFQRNCQNSS